MDKSKKIVKMVFCNRDKGSLKEREFSCMKKIMGERECLLSSICTHEFYVMLKLVKSASFSWKLK